MMSRKSNTFLEHEPIVDALERDITDYLTEMSSTDMNSALSVRHTGLLHACNDIERIGDHGETLAKKARTIFEDDVHFSDEARAELVKLSEMVLHASGRALESLEKMIKLLLTKQYNFAATLSIIKKKFVRIILSA